MSFPSTAAQARSFQAEGADTGAGIGPRWVAQGGTGVASADDLMAAYYNPAGLAALDGLSLSVSRQLDAELHVINFLGIAGHLPVDEWIGGRLGVAALYFPRIHGRASGAFSSSDFESIFLRYLLPGISGDFDGDIDTKTKVYRLALGYAPSGGARWSVGAYLDRIDCKSTFCGVHATSSGYSLQSTGATAIGSGLGWRWAPDPAWTVAAAVTDLHTQLKVKSVVTDSAGTRETETTGFFPRRITTGVAWRPGAGDRLAADLDVLKGRYGNSQLDLQVLRLGGERQRGDWSWRAGAVVPLKVYSSASGQIKSPFPLSPTVGIGWRAGVLKIDFALYAHAVMSMHKGTPVPSADLALSLDF